jgi:hypothetical protein
MCERKDVRLKRWDGQVIRTEDLDEKTLAAILNAEPGQRSKKPGGGWRTPEQVTAHNRAEKFFPHAI